MATFKRRIWHQTLAIAIVPVLLGGFLFSTLFGLLSDISETAHQEQQASDFCDMVNENVAIAASATLAAYRYWETRQPRYREEYEGILNDAIKRNLTQIRSDVNNRFERDYLEANMDLFVHMRTEARLLLRLRNAGDELELLRRAQGLLGMMGRLHDKNVQTLVTLEKELAQLESKLEQRRQQTRALLLGGFAACCFGTLYLAAIVRRSIVGRIVWLRQYVDGLMRRNTLAMPMGGTDEIAELEQSFLYMSNNIREAIRREQATLFGAKVICAVKPDGRVAASNNDSFVVGTNIFDSLDESARSEFLMALNQARDSGASVTVELGELSWSCNWSVEESTFYCVAHDISELKHREQQLRANQERVRVLMQSMPAALFVTDKDGKILRVNEESRKLIGLSEQELIGRRLDELGHFAAGARVAIQRDDGSEAWCEVSQVVLDEQRLIIALNVTDKMQMEQMRDRLKAMIAHDIGAPLTSIQATFKSIERKRYGEIDEPGMQRAANALAETARLSALFKDFLAIERHHASEWSMTVSNVDLAEVLNRSADAMRTLASASNVTIEVSPVACTMSGDKDKLIQVFVNLISNALKFSPKDAKIFVESTLAENAVRVSVRDQGPGIPDELREKIFEPFKQTSVEDATVKGGSGLGLAICKSIVEAHNGKIRAENGTAGGAEFIVEFQLM